MPCHIEKRATQPLTCLRPSISFDSARNALLALLEALALGPQDRVLLPAYIGWSPREGSGVFDPVLKAGVSFVFYRMTRGLQIDVEDVYAKLSKSKVRLLVLIHYFGYPDPSAAQVVEYARERGILVVEDEAHALYSDWVGGVCGRLGDFCIYSLHKMLPLSSGGLLVVNDPKAHNEVIRKVKRSLRVAELDANPLDYDLWRIAYARRTNVDALLDLLRPLYGKVKPLFPPPPYGVVPQTLPVVITTESRDDVYHKLNASGFGVVSLYHTLVDAIAQAEYPDSHWLSKRILNLPVHQDTSPSVLKSMVRRMATLL